MSQNLYKRRILCLLMTFLLLFSQLSSFAAFSNNRLEKTTIVMIDVSGSMKMPDKEQNSLKFAKLLVDLAQNKKEKIGFIAFNETILINIEPTLITDFNVESIKQQLSSLTYAKNTDLGFPLLSASKILEKTGGQIILLSDGEVDLTNSTKTRTNSDNKIDQHKAILLCKEKNISIHTFTLKTSRENDMTENALLSQSTNGSSFLLDPSSALLPQFLSAYASSQNLYLSKISNVLTKGTQQYIDVDLPYIDFIQNLDYVFLTSDQIKQCDYNDSTTARISISDRYTCIQNASHTLRKQLLSFNAAPNIEIEIYTLKQINFIPDLIYNDQNSEFQARLINPLTNKPLDSSTVLPITVTIYKGSQTLDYISLAKGSELYRRPYNIPPGDDFSAFATVTIDNDQLNSSTISLPSGIAAPVALISPPLNYKKVEEIILDLDMFFNYEKKEGLIYSISSSDIESEFIISKNKLLLKKPHAIKNGFLTIKAEDPFGSFVENKIQISITESIFISIATAIAIFLALLAIVVLVISIKVKKTPLFNGVFVGTFIHTKNGKDLPQFICLKDVLSKKAKLTLQQLFTICNVTENLIESQNIFFLAQPNNEILFYHTTNCKVLIESETIHHGQKFLLRYGNHIFIFFEDSSTELEIKYLDAKPSPNDGNRKLAIKMNRN